MNLGVPLCLISFRLVLYFGGIFSFRFLLVFLYLLSKADIGGSRVESALEDIFPVDSRHVGSFARATVAFSRVLAHVCDEEEAGNGVCRHGRSVTANYRQRQTPLGESKHSDFRRGLSGRFPAAKLKTPRDVLEGVVHFL